MARPHARKKRSGHVSTSTRLPHCYFKKWPRKVLGALTQMGTPVPSTGQEAISAGLAIMQLREGILRNL